MTGQNLAVHNITIKTMLKNFPTNEICTSCRLNVNTTPNLNYLTDDKRSNSIQHYFMNPRKCSWSVFIKIGRGCPRTHRNSMKTP